MIKTGYSFRVAVGHVPDVVKRIKEIGWKKAPICDRVSTFGFNRFTKECKKQGLSPVYGVEIAVATRMGDRKPVLDYWRFLAKKSLRPLHDLIAQATANSDHEPSLTYKEALAAKDVIKIAGERVQLDELLAHKDRKDFYIGLSPAAPKALIKEAQRRKLQFIACGNNVYPNKEDIEFYRVTLGKRADTQTYPQWIVSDSEWREACEWVADKKTLDLALKNRNAVFQSCTAEMKKATLLVPEKPKSLRQLCIEGAKRTGINLKDQVYKERLDRELKLIAEKKFEDYFFVIADMINWAKRRMIVGPARGSSCGSLVCYLLNITTIDPIPFGLIFERFIDTTRTDLPDIDIDFSDERRNMVFKYAEDKYGIDRVARLGTVGLFKPRSALNQAGIALQIPKWQVEKVLDGVIERSGGDSRALQALEDTLNDTEAGRKMLNDFPEVKIAGRMEGHPNNASQHAAGIVVTQDPLAEYVAVDSRTKAAMVDKKDAEDLNLLKIDALGLTQLSIFERTLQLIGKKDVSGYLETLPLNDKKAFDVLNKGHFAGIFQFTGGALQSLVKQVKVNSLDDMVAITALARPGPMAAGGANSWVKRRTGKEKVTSVHPMLTELTKETYGIIVYQEQVLNIMRNMGQMNWADTNAVRKAMSGRLGNEFFENYRKKFVGGAVKSGVDEESATEVWKNVNTFGSWCLAAGTKIKLARKLKDGRRSVKIEELATMKQLPVLHSLFSDGRIKWQRSKALKCNGLKSCKTFKFSNGAEVTCTTDHQFIINGKWKPISEAKIGDKFKFSTEKGARKKHNQHMTQQDFIGSKYKIPQEGFPKGENHPLWKGGTFHYLNKFREKMQGKPCKDCGRLNKKRMEAHHNDFNDGHTRPKDLTWLCPSCHALRHRKKGNRIPKCQRGLTTTEFKLVNSKVAGKRMTYDIEMPEHHNFVLENDLITHNSFNKSHAVAYGIVSYYSCWLKAHHPLEFAAATLDAETDPAKQIALLRELKEEGINYIPVDPETSIDRWTVKNKKMLVGPLTAIKGIGPAAVLEIMDARKQGIPVRDSLLKRLSLAKTEIDTLYPIADAVKRQWPDLTDVIHPASLALLKSVKQVQCGHDGEVLILAVVRKIAPKDENEPVNIEKRLARRGANANGWDGKLKGPTAALNLFFMDDTDEIFAKIDRYRFEEHGRAVVERGKAGKAIYAVKGTVPRDFRMISVTNIRYLGELGASLNQSSAGGKEKLNAGEQKVESD